MPPPYKPPPPNDDSPLAPHPRAIGPEAETNVPCPICRQGMVPASLSTHVKYVLAGGRSEPPDPPSSTAHDVTELPPDSEAAPPRRGT